jgi:chromosome segregation ATPase
MKNSKAIEREIADLQNSREAVAESHSRAHSDLLNARKQLVKGTGSAEEVTAAQGTFAGLDGALADADAMLSDLRIKLQAARQIEGHDALFFRMAEIAAAGNQNFADFERLRSEINEALKSLCPNLLDAYAGMRAARQSFLGTAAQLAPIITKHDYAGPGTPEQQAQLSQLVAELERRGVDLKAVSAEWLGATSRLDTWPRIVELEPFGELIDTALKIMDAYRVQQEAQKKVA